MRQFGLIGYPLSHSFSKRYFSDKFKENNIPDACYELFPLEQIADFLMLLEDQPDLVGLNVTIPYKQAIIPYLDELSPVAEAIGAVNTIAFRNGRRIGYNTDVPGFEKDLLDFLGDSQLTNKRALILGTGGAALAVQYVLSGLDIPYLLVSRSCEKGDLTYSALDKEIILSHSLIINTTPLGMSPYVAASPAIPYEHLNEDHYLYDLVYNPLHTTFMTQGAARGAKTRNGLGMLYEQAEQAWSIWNTSPEIE